MMDRNSEDIATEPRRKSAPFGSGGRFLWLQALLLVLTFFSTSVFGLALKRSFDGGHQLSESDWLFGFQQLFAGHPMLLDGLAYSIPLLLILLAHEMGHYFLCRYWKVDATLPFFGPSPSLLGTVGAFIWIRSPIYRRRALFDIGIFGPLTGFVVLIPFLVAGIWQSKVCANVQPGHGFVFGTPMLVALLEKLRFSGVPSSNVCLHPMAMGAWAGLLATSINLLPVGQLDGGHIVYAVFGERAHQFISWISIVGLGIGGLVYWPWWIWAIAMFFFRRHPLIHDEEPVGPGRQALSLVALALLILSFSIVPVQAG